MAKAIFDAARVLRAQAWCLGDRIDTRLLERSEPLATSPFTVRAGAAGLVVIFRYGAVVAFELDAHEEASFLELLRPAVTGAFTRPASEDAEILVDPETHQDHVTSDGSICLRVADLPRLLCVAHVLAKSAVLAHYEERIAQLFERIETQADRLRSSGHIPTRGKELLRQIGDVLLAQTRTVARVEVTEKPELTWDEPELDHLYVRLSLEYELRSRDLALARKQELIWDTAQTLFDVLQNRRTLRVEWYITILILVEIAMLAYDMMH